MNDHHALIVMAIGLLILGLSLGYLIGIASDRDAYVPMPAPATSAPK